MSSEDIVSFEELLRLPMRKVESHGRWLRSSAADKAPLAASVWGRAGDAAGGDPQIPPEHFEGVVSN